MKTRILAASAAAASLLLTSVNFASADTFSVSCSGTPSASSITWTAASSGGVAPVAFLWGNGSTSTAQTVSYSPGAHTITIEATDVSSTVATSTCAATIATNATTGTTTPGTGGGVQDKIKALLQQIATLKAELARLVAARFGGTLENPPFIPPGQIARMACIELGRNLRHGDHGDDVRKLQMMLRSDPSTGFTAEPTGFFGPVTAKAMMKFQVKHGIVSSEGATDGSAGQLTRGFFNRSCGKGLIKHGENWLHASSSSKLHDDDDDNNNDDNATSSRGKSSENKWKGKGRNASSTDDDPSELDDDGDDD